MQEIVLQADTGVDGSSCSVAAGLKSMLVGGEGQAVIHSQLVAAENIQSLLAAHQLTLDRLSTKAIKGVPW